MGKWNVFLAVEWWITSVNKMMKLENYPFIIKYFLIIVAIKFKQVSSIDAKEWLGSVWEIRLCA